MDGTEIVHVWGGVPVGGGVCFYSVEKGNREKNMERKNQNEQLTDDTMQGIYGKVDADGG